MNHQRYRIKSLLAALLLANLVAPILGCRTPTVQSPKPGYYHDNVAIKDIPPPPPETPKELQKTTLPTYTIEPPDVLSIEGIHLIPRNPYVLRTSDVVAIKVVNALPDEPIDGLYPIQPGGIINLGPTYGPIEIARMTVEQAESHIVQILRQRLDLKAPEVSITLSQFAGMQQISGQHLVGMDGTITLGTYGSVFVTGMTLAEAKLAVENHLQRFLDSPEVAVDVSAYNSRVYYVITEGAGLGDGVSRFPITGNETVLDAISNINGMTEVSSKRIWVARPQPCSGQMQILPVDWRELTALGEADTNFQILPGDRVFIAEDEWVAFDTNTAKVLDPIQRIFGFSILGANTASRFTGRVLYGGGLRGAFGGTQNNISVQP